MEAVSQARDTAERAVIGSVILAPDMLDAVLNVGLTSDDFAVPENAAIWYAIIVLVENREPIDLVTVMDCLETQKKLAAAGGVAYLSSVIEGAFAPSQAVAHAKVVKRHSARDRLAHAGQRVQSQAKDGDVGEAIAEGVDTLQAIGKGLAPAGHRNIRAIMADLHLDGAGAPETLPTGLKWVDHMTGGLVLGEFTLIGAWSGHGKSAYASQIAVNLARAGVPVAYFSVEMTERALSERLVAQATGIFIRKMREGKLSTQERAQAEEAKAGIAALPLIIRCGSLRLSALLAEARGMAAERGVKLVVVDYIQNVTSAAQERRLQVEDIAQGLLGLALDKNIAVMGLSQLRKRDEERKGGPTMHDLKESGALFECPHVVGLLYRAHIKEHEDCPVCGGQFGGCHACDGMGGPTLDKTAQLCIEKNRNGEAGMIDLAWRGRYLSFGDLTHEAISV